jgi:hypothetical protein
MTISIKERAEKRKRGKEENYIPDRRYRTQYQLPGSHSVCELMEKIVK